jgi:hypothetical protein
MAVLVMIGAGATYAVTRPSSQKDESVGAAPSAAAPQIAAASTGPSPEAEGPPPENAFVDLTLEGAPRGARVLLEGKPIGEAPGPLSIPSGETPVQLTVTAPGYDTGKVAIVPNQATSATVVMRKRAPGPTPAREGIPSDLENPF